MLVNWVPTLSSEGVPTLVATDVAVWEEGAAGLTRYNFSDEQAPAWAGNLAGWKAAPGDMTACTPGAVFSTASLQCEKCPPGSFQEGSRCTPCPPGFYAPDSGTLQCLPCLRSGYAEEAGMVACRACEGNYEVAAGTTAAVSGEACVCKSGFTFNCKWHIWKVCRGLGVEG